MLSSFENVYEKPQHIAYDMSITIFELEYLMMNGYAYAVSADHEAAILTSPIADSDWY